MRKRDIRKTHAYSAQRSGSKKYAKVERRSRRKPRWLFIFLIINTGMP